jgi:S-adenosylmethionine-diacylglycerol 3-amino-3-carboxypropyl transferase
MPVRLGLKFAVVREDHELEAHVIRTFGVRRALIVASGGCTALSLLAEHPELEVTAFDLNPRQLEQVRDKAAAAALGELARLNVGDPDEHGLNQSGEFEGLFRTLRQMLLGFVTTEGELERFFHGDAATRAELATAWTTHRFWPGCFAACFSDGLLHAMFGPAATQHAAPGSYPGYFRELFERGLRRDDAAHNPFLQHVLLGTYRPDDAPAYTRDRRGRMPQLILGGLEAVAELERFDLFSLSNVFDWSDDALVADWASRIKRAARPGSVVLLRQLNNTRDLRRHFAPELVFDDALGVALQARDRSLFYNRIEVGRSI